MSLPFPGWSAPRVAGHWAMTPNAVEDGARRRHRGLQPPTGVSGPAAARDARRTAGPGHQGRPRHLRRPAAGRRQAERRDDRRSGRVDHHRGEEYLFYPAPRFDVAFIRGHHRRRRRQPHHRAEAAKLGCWPRRSAARNSGGLVIAQVKRLAAGDTLSAERWSSPAIWSTICRQRGNADAIDDYNPAFSGEVRVPFGRSPRCR